MPQIKFAHVISFSSEDPAYPASNILDSGVNKKWRCRSVGEKSAIIVLQLEKASQITAIDIGNEHSAFVEALVGRSGGSEDFQVLLVTSSFMTPIESRNSTVTNRVRMFTYENLSPETRDQKWDLLKLVCTQPFNSHVQYGLAFVKLQGSTDAASVKRNQDQNMIGRFKLREVSPDHDSLAAGSLFARQKESGSNSPSALTTAAAIREASNVNSSKTKFSPAITAKGKQATQNQHDLHEISDDENDNKKKRINRNRNELLYDSEDMKPNKRLDKLIKIDNDHKDKIKKQEEQNKTKHNKKESTTKPTKVKDTPKFKDFINSDKQDNNSSTSSNASPSNTRTKNALSNDSTKQTNDSSQSSARKMAKRPVESPKQDANSSLKKVCLSKPDVKRQYKPFRELLEGVTLVISGYQNPLRGHLRQMALDMGAKYKPDWNNQCTHLICAFRNTPKYQQVFGLGKIVKKEWIEHCHSQRKRLPWRRYSLDPNDSKAPESEEEIWDDSHCPGTSTDSDIHHDTVAQYDNDNAVCDSSGSNTEDEIEKIRQKQKSDTSLANVEPDENGQNTDKVVDPFEVETDCDLDPPAQQNTNTSDDLPALPSFFKGLTFYLNETLGAVTMIKLKRYIEAYGGIVAEKLQNNVNYCIVEPLTNHKMPTQYEKPQHVKPEWIWECNDMEMLLPIKRYLLPNEELA